MKLLLLLAATAGAPEAKEAFVAAYVDRHREEACGMHWVGNPVYPQCIAHLRWQAERAFEAQARAAGQR